MKRVKYTTWNIAKLIFNETKKIIKLIFGERTLCNSVYRKLICLRAIYYDPHKVEVTRHRSEGKILRKTQGASKPLLGFSGIHPLRFNYTLSLTVSKCPISCRLHANTCKRILKIIVNFSSSFIVNFLRYKYSYLCDPMASPYCLTFSWHYQNFGVIFLLTPAGGSDF